MIKSNYGWRRCFKFIFKSMLVAWILVGILIGIEIVYFYQILSDDTPLEKADMIVVFVGSAGRIEAGHKLAIAGYAPYLVISPAIRTKVKAYSEKYGLSPTVKYAIEDKARSTFENALYTKKIILEHKFNSVILVTSSCHLPRSHILLKMLLAGDKIKIQPFGIEKNQRDLISPKGKIIYNEMLKVWGSIAELLSYKVRGRVSQQNKEDWRVIKRLKSTFLFR